MSGVPVAEPRWLVRRRAEAAAAMVEAHTAPPELACIHYGVSFAQFEACRRTAAKAARWSIAARARQGLLQLGRRPRLH